MRYFLTMCSYPANHPMITIYNSYILPKFKKYASLHDFHVMEIKTNIAKPRHPNWARLFWIQERMNSMNDGDIINCFDADCVIMKFDKPFIFLTDFAIPLESTGVACMGFFSLRISKWSRNFIKTLCSKEFYFKDSKFTENYSFYQYLGLEFGDEVKDTNHIKILPPEYNVTVNPNDLKRVELDQTEKDLMCYYKPELYRSFDDTIIRHLAAGTIYRPYAKKYLL